MLIQTLISTLLCRLYPSDIANYYIFFILAAGMPLTINNPMVEDETEFTTVSSLRHAFNMDESTVTTPVSSSIPPIIIVDSPDQDLEDVQITHECAI